MQLTALKHDHTCMLPSGVVVQKRWMAPITTDGRCDAPARECLLRRNCAPLNGKIIACNPSKCRILQ
ncbi:hypothetical protein BDR03DRAFT_963656 [Suillus americanus]|nr:hypothetical protein BDR03DRAFT_963656 [Suillus americanus]